jgi:hypothetical protein
MAEAEKFHRASTQQNLRPDFETDRQRFRNRLRPAHRAERGNHGS